MGSQQTYKARTFNLSKLNGISDRTLEMHFKLYEGYVKATNSLNERIRELLRGSSVEEKEMPDYSGLTRRLGYEYNGMVLHEYYFENLKRDGGGDPEKSAPFRTAAEKSFGSYENWKKDFVSMAKMRGIGWTITFRDPSNQQLSNHWVEEHQMGNIAGFAPILVMDVWEHAYLLDYAPADRPKYVEAFFSNIDWQAVGKRLTEGAKTAAVEETREPALAGAR